MRIRNDLSSKAYNTFGIDIPLDCLVEIEDRRDLEYIASLDEFRVLGGGSNILITGDIKTPVVYMNNKGIEVVIDDDNYCLVEFAAGENWHESVLWALDNDLGGLENLSLIPGKCGAAPMQNIGAYGVEIKDILHSVRAFDLENAFEMTFHNSECGFAYRSSHFKTKWKGRFVITSIILKLSKAGYHTLNIAYGAIQSELEKQSITHPTIRDISNAVITIRRSKLPDPAKLGNAGSFFKNPIVSKSKFDELIQLFPDLVAYKHGEKMKLAAGWLIDKCGLKGTRDESGAATHDRQALVIVRRGEATGQDVLSLSSRIKNEVKRTFGVDLEEEVNIWS